jgi:hypothetical protein
MAGDLLGVPLGAAQSKPGWPGADFATVAASLVVAASVGWAAHKRRRRRRQQLVGLGDSSVSSSLASLQSPPAAAGRGHGWEQVGNVGGQRSAALHALTPRGGRCACGSRALNARRRTAFSMGLLEALRSLAASLLRQLFCQRYRGPQAHPVSPAPHYAYGVGDAVGRRAYMEDRHFAAGRVGGADGVSVYGVYDGHAGPAAAE